MAVFNERYLVEALSNTNKKDNSISRKSELDTVTNYAREILSDFKKKFTDKRYEFGIYSKQFYDGYKEQYDDFITEISDDMYIIYCDTSELKHGGFNNKEYNEYRKNVDFIINSIVKSLSNKVKKDNNLHGKIEIDGDQFADYISYVLK